jgi:hypothetical protein
MLQYFQYICCHDKLFQTLKLHTTEISQNIKDHLSPKPLSIAERFRFHKRKQLEGESINDYVAVRKVSLPNIVILESRTC